jgi:hypothetical protein
MSRRILKVVLGALLAALVIAQFFQPARTNPASDPASSFQAVARPPADVTAIVRRSCHDCHSNDTAWPWYSGVSPVSWLVAQDVQGGRTHLNFSEWGRFGPGMARSRSHEICEEATSGRMPLWYYVPLHPAARLSRNEISTLCTSWWRSDEVHVRAGAAASLPN